MTDVLNRVIIVIAQAGGAMRTSDLLTALAEIGYSSKRVYDSIEASVKAKRPKLLRTGRVYGLSRAGVDAAAKLGVVVDHREALYLRRDIVKAARERAGRRRRTRRRQIRFLKVLREEGRVVSMRCLRSTYHAGRQVTLELPPDVVEEMRAELRRRGITRGIGRLIRLSWRIAREQIMAWPTMKPKPRPPAREFVPPPFDPPRVEVPDPPVFCEILASKLESVQAAERAAARQREIEARCRPALDRLELSPARLSVLAPIMGLSTTTAWDRLQVAVDAGMIVKVGPLYALPGAVPAATLRVQIVRELARARLGIAELARKLGADKAKVKATVKGLILSGRVARVGPGEYTTTMRGE